MKKKYPYLKDISFLNKIYDQHIKTLYTRISVLDWQEHLLQEVSGKVISGNISINGDSSVRRVANLSVKITNNDDLYKNVDSLFTINKKVFIEIGIRNNYAHLGEEYYSNYPIIWFPFGTYIIQNHSIVHSLTDLSLSLTLGDKMCTLNGEAGGTIPASTNFESYDTLGPDGDLHTEPLRINRIIPEMVNHFGNEDLNNIIVNDVTDKIKQVLKWRSNNPLYLWQNKLNPYNVFYTTINTTGSGLDTQDWNIKKITYDYDAGYSYVDFVYPGELTANAGDSVCTVLDKIKETLGNYEYYYDVFGNFIFQEIKNYVNVSEWRTAFNNLKEHPYQSVYLPYSYNTRLSTSVYDFNDSKFIISYSNSPQFNMIKNDFVVWGNKKDMSGVDYPCRYHLAIDKRPKLSEPMINSLPICFDTNVSDGIRRCFTIDKIYVDLDLLKQEHPTGIVGKYYYIVGDGVYTWVSDVKNYNDLLSNYLTAADTTEQVTSYSEDTDIVSDYIRLPLASYYGTGEFEIPIQTDWRNILYFQGVFDSAQGLTTNYYWAELCNEWPKLYDIENNVWQDGVLDFPSSFDWWLDLIDNDSTITKFSVDNIGRRSYSIVDSKCNCVFEPDIPDVIMVNTADVDSRSKMTDEELRELGLIPTQVPDSIYNAVVTGGTFNSCYQHVRQLLTNYTDYNESISVTCIPIYHLEPNTRVFFNDPESGIYGDYIINTISFDLSNTGTMNITAKKVIEKI